MSTATLAAPGGFSHLLIRASAGTGKTFQLSNRYLSLLAAGVKPEGILATTFTRKAAGEIFDRILYRLAQAATNGPSLEQLSRHIADGRLTRDECLDLLASATRNLHRLRVGTLDSFFVQIAGSFRLELGLPPGWVIADKVTDDLLRARAIEATLAQDSTADLMTLLHLLTKAETKRSISRVVGDAVESAYKMFQETEPEAWRKLHRVRGLEEAEIADVVRRIEAYPLTGQLDTKRNESLERMFAGDWFGFAQIGMSGKVAAGETTICRKEIPADLAALFERLIDHARAQIINPIVEHTEATHRLLEKFDAEYRRLKQEERVLLFDDVTRNIARSGQLDDEAQLGFRLDGSLRHLLLDEFQDTSLAQWQVLRPFAKAVTEEADGSFFCVGDVKQAIYGWRGGVAQIFDAIEQELDGLAHQDLATSYRSAPPIIETVNRLFQNLLAHEKLDSYEPMVAQWQRNFPEHSTSRESLPGYACVRAMPAPPAEDGEVDVAEFREAYIAQYVKSLLEASPGMEIGVLVRRNDMVRRLIFALRGLGIPASEEAGNPLVDSAAVGLVMSLLKLADHPGDTVARYHLATSPLAAHFGIARHDDDAAAAKLSLALRRELVEDGYGPAALRWAKLIAPSCNQRELSRLDQLVELAYRYEPRDSLRADRFLALIAEERVSDPTAAPVRVMNIHQAKGLQFDIVVLPELDVNLYGHYEPYVVSRPSPIEPIDTVVGYVNKELWPLFPPSIQRVYEHANDRHVTEMLCMLYVGATRAVHAMHMLLDDADAATGTIPKSLAGLVRAALCENRPIAAGEIGYECGAADWYEQLLAPPEPFAAPAPPQLFHIELRAGERERGWQRTSPSQLEGGGTRHIQEILRPARGAGQDFGTLIHAWFEQVNWLEEGLPDDAELARLAVSAAAWPGDPKAEITQFKQWLAQPGLKTLLTQAEFRRDLLCECDHLAVETEYGFALKREGQLLTGNIDRFVLYERDGEVVAADIIDYKTDSIKPGDKPARDEKVEYYRPQLAAYAAAVRQMYGLSPERTRARLVLLATGEIVTIEGPQAHEVPARSGRPHRQPTQRTLF